MSKTSKKVVDISVAPFPKRALSFAVLFTLFSLLWISLNYVFFHKSLSEIKIDRKIESLANNILYLGSSAVQSAKQAANTGNQKWIDDHDASFREADQNILEVRKLSYNESILKALFHVSDHLSSVKKLDSEIFDKAKAGQREDASHIITSKTYAMHRQEFSESTHNLSVIMNGYLQQKLKVFDQSLTIALWVTLGGVVCLLFFWFIVIKKLSLWQRALRDAVAKAEVANIAKSDFLANMSHEIRTPINSIIGVSRLIVESSRSEEIRNWASIVQGSGESLLGIINDILDLTKIDAGKMMLNRQSFDLSLAIGEVTDLLLLSCREKGIELIVYFANDVPKNCIGDVGRFKQILSNLLNNAVKFTTYGYVLVKVQMRMRQDNKLWLYCRVEDTGIGIREEMKIKIFDRFSQVEESTTRRFGGTGLGLAISQKLTQLMGGRIKLLSSKVDSGSTFSFILPFEFDLQHRGQFDFSVTLKLNRLRALVVDNMEISRKMLQKSVRKFGLSCDVASSLSEAEQLIYQSDASTMKYDFILLDYKFEEGHALTFSKKMKALPACSKVSIIMVTAFGRFADMQRLTDHGIDAFLIKPFYPIQLETTMKVLREKVEKGLSLPLITRHSLVNYIHGKALDEENNSEKRESYPELSVLIVDDLAVNRMLVSRIIEKLECSFLTATNGVEAIEMVLAHKIDIVFMDCQMPEMDGYEATSLIRKRELEKGGHVTIIALTADAMTGDKDRCLEAGMDDYLYKPFKPTQIVDMLIKWANKEEGMQIEKKS